MPPPVVPPAAPAATPEAAEVVPDAAEAVPAAEEDEPATGPDPRALRAISRQERKEAKATLRREQQEARAAARQAKAAAKIAAKTGRPVEIEHVLPDEEPEAGSTDPVERAVAAVAAEAAEESAITEPDADVEATQLDLPPVDAELEPMAPTDPRARAAARVQRRLGKDADKISAAEARARAREEARRRRTQAKELRAGVVAEEPVVRAPDEDLVDDVVMDEVVVDEPLLEQTLVTEPVIEEPIAEEPVIEEPVAEEPVIEEPVIEEPVAEEPVLEESVAEPATDEGLGAMPPPTVAAPEAVTPTPAPEPRRPWPAPPARQTVDEDVDETEGRSPLASIAGILGLVCLGISVLLAVGALLVALGVDSGGLYGVLEAVANALVGPLKHAFDFSGANAERKEHFIAWGAGSIGYLVLSFVGQAVQRANTDE